MKNEDIYDDITTYLKKFENNFLKVDSNSIRFDNILSNFFIIYVEVYRFDVVITTSDNVTKKFIINNNFLADIKQYCSEYLNNYYTNNNLSDFDSIFDIPVIDEVEFVKYILSNLKSENITIKNFLILYNQKAYRSLQKYFNESEFDYLINASKFDLI